MTHYTVVWGWDSSATPKGIFANSPTDAAVAYAMGDNNEWGNGSRPFVFVTDATGNQWTVWVRASVSFAAEAIEDGNS